MKPSVLLFLTSDYTTVLCSIILVICLVLFHFLLWSSNPIYCLFFLLFFIIWQAGILLMLNLSYLAFILISVYGGAIVVLFLLVSMLFNKKLDSVIIKKPAGY